MYNLYTFVQLSDRSMLVLAETTGRCGVHLINEGVIVANGMVSIMTQVTGPSAANRLDAQFECRVDRSRSYSPCK